MLFFSCFFSVSGFGERPGLSIYVMLDLLTPNWYGWNHHVCHAQTITGKTALVEPQCQRTQTCKPVGLLIMMCSCGLWSWDFDSGSDFWMSEWSTASWMNLQKPKLGLEDGNWDNLLGSMLNAGGCAWGSLRAFLCQFYTLSGAHGKLQDTFLHSDSHHRRSPCPIWALHAFCIPGATWHASWWTPEAPTSRALNDRSGNCCKQREGWTGRYYCCGLGTAQLLLGETTFLLGDVCGRRAVEL